MNTDSNLDDMLRSLDPLTEELDQSIERRRGDIWAAVVAEPAPVPVRTRVRPRHLIGVTSLATIGAAAALVIGLLPGTAPIGAAAAALQRAAHVDASSATLPTLAAGQFYYQQSTVSMVCQFASPLMGMNAKNFTYVSDGTMQSWTSGSGAGQVTITPSTVGANGSHFATVQDEERWVALGKPFNPCAVMDSSNALNNNPANVNPQNAAGTAGGYATSISLYSGFGFNLGWSTQTTQLASGTSVNNLPDNVSQIASMLANGEINLDGSVSHSPQVCPSGVGQGVGCNTFEQLEVIEHLLQLPDASAKFGSVLYQVMAQMPGATLVGSLTDPSGRIGEGVVVPIDQNEKLEVILDSATGALLSCAALIAANSGAALTTPSASGYSPIAQVSFGPITVVQGVGTTSRNSAP
jgi:hypothetical protein